MVTKFCCIFVQRFKYNIMDIEVNDFLKSSCRDYENDECTERDAENLFDILTDKFPEKDHSMLVRAARNWCGL